MTLAIITAVLFAIIIILGIILYRAKEPAEENKRIIEREYQKKNDRVYQDLYKERYISPKP